MNVKRKEIMLSREEMIEAIRKAKIVYFAVFVGDKRGVEDVSYVKGSKKGLLDFIYGSNDDWYFKAQVEGKRLLVG